METTIRIPNSTSKTVDALFVCTVCNGTGKMPCMRTHPTPRGLIQEPVMCYVGAGVTCYECRGVGFEGQRAR